MAKKLTILIFSLFQLFTTAAQSVNLVSETDDAVIVDITVYGQKEKKVVEAAEPLLYESVFFRGFPDSYTCRDGLVGTDENVMKMHEVYFKEMTQGGRFASFITSTRLVNYNKKNNKEGVVRYVVNMRALRQDLENKGVKRRFGF